jgi:predicted secreted protein
MSCSDDSKTVKELRIGKDESLSRLKPKKPVKIQLKRNAKGEYSWNIKGDNVDEIIKADSKLKSVILKNNKEAER